MPDITMCEGNNCPLKETCYRYKAKPSEFAQSFFIGTPFEIIEGEPKCNHYWEIKNKKNENSHL